MREIQRDEGYKRYEIRGEREGVIKRRGQERMVVTDRDGCGRDQGGR